MNVKFGEIFTAGFPVVSLHKMQYADLYIEETEKKGKGVFTHTAIPAGGLVETAPVIVMNEGDRRHLDQTKLHDYIFEWKPENKNLCCVALGYVSIYNHSPASNCTYEMDYEAATISVYTVREVEKGEELTINYNGDWNDTGKVWFDTAP